MQMNGLAFQHPLVVGSVNCAFFSFATMKTTGGEMILYSFIMDSSECRLHEDAKAASIGQNEDHQKAGGYDWEIITG